jgi:hypothetical protein
VNSPISRPIKTLFAFTKTFLLGDFRRARLPVGSKAWVLLEKTPIFIGCARETVWNELRAAALKGDGERCERDFLTLALRSSNSKSMTFGNQPSAVPRVTSDFPDDLDANSPSRLSLHQSMQLAGEVGPEKSSVGKGRLDSCIASIRQTLAKDAASYATEPSRSNLMAVQHTVRRMYGECVARDVANLV